MKTKMNRRKFPASYGDFTLARPICDAFNQAAVSLRLGGRRLLRDADNAKITHLPEGNPLLSRDVLPGGNL